MAAFKRGFSRSTSSSLAAMSLPSLAESDSDSLEFQDTFADLVDEALVCIADLLDHDYFKNAQQECVLAVEAAFDVDDSLSWIELMTLPPLQCAPCGQVYIILFSLSIVLGFIYECFVYLNYIQKHGKGMCSSLARPNFDIRLSFLCFCCVAHTHFYFSLLFFYKRNPIETI